MVIWSCVLAVMCISSGMAAHHVQSGPILKPTPSEVLFRVGQTRLLVLKCAVEGDASKVKFLWKKYGQPLEIDTEAAQHDEGTIFTHEPTLEEVGTYQCLAKSDAGVASTNIISVENMYINVPNVTVQRHKPVEGKPYKLNCEIPDAYPKPKITWKYQYEMDKSISRIILNPHIIQAPDGNLYFTNITQEDTEKNYKYVCVARSPAVDTEVVLAEHVIEEVIPSGVQNGELTLQYVTNDMTAKAGDVTMIYCIYGGNPLAYPDWYKDGKNINNEPKDRVTRYNGSSGQRLLIRKTFLEDEGNYTCLVNNGVGKPMNHTMHLTVVSAPEFLKPIEPRYVGKAHKTVTIVCEIAGVPNVELTWTYNAEPLKPNARINVNQYEQDTVSHSHLSITKLNVNDKGYYGCRGVNQIGNIYAETLLTVSVDNM